MQLILEQVAGQGPVQGPDAIPEREVEFAEPARIHVRAPVGNAFELELDLASHQRPGSIELGLFQGDRPGAGYRLVYNAGSQPGLSLVRLGADGGEVIASSEGALNLEDGRFPLWKVRFGDLRGRPVIGINAPCPGNIRHVRLPCDGPFGPSGSKR